MTCAITWSRLHADAIPTRPTGICVMTRRWTLRPPTFPPRVLSAHALDQLSQVCNLDIEPSFRNAPEAEHAAAVLLETAAAPRGDQVLLPEVLALRAIVRHIHVAVHTGETLTTEYLQRLIERADHDNIRKAQRVSCP